MAVTVLAVFAAGGAYAAWTIDPRGDCVEAWQPSDLLRGPAAIANSVVLPVRSAIGGFQLGRQEPGPDWKSRIMLPPLLTVAGGGMGLLEGLLWMGTGLGDTVSGGALALAPVEATRMSVDPVTPLFAPAATPALDPCGRPVSPKR